MNDIEQLYREHHQQLRRYLTRLVSDRMAAEDLCHETFVKALLHCDDRDQVASARGWLYRIAKNTAYDHLRRQRRVVMTPLTDAHEAIAGAAAPESQFADAEPIWAALNHLPDYYRVPLLLQVGAGYPIRDIAATLRCNVNTVKTRVHRARLHFREFYGAIDTASASEAIVDRTLEKDGSDAQTLFELRHYLERRGVAPTGSHPKAGPGDDRATPVKE